MLRRFKYVHLYCNQVNTLEFVNVIVPGVRKYFRNITIDMRRPFLTNIDDVIAENLVSIRISDTKKPFNEQPEIKESEQNIFYEENFSRPMTPNGVGNNSNTGRIECKELILYDGFLMQRLFNTMINEKKNRILIMFI